MSGPNGTLENRLNALSLAANQPAPAQAAGTVPRATAFTVSAAGTSLPGSWNLRINSPPEARLILSGNTRDTSPRIGMFPGKVLATSSTMGPAWVATEVPRVATINAARPVAIFIGYSFGRRRNAWSRGAQMHELIFIVPRHDA